MNRRKSREIAMKILFSITLGGDDVNRAINNFKTSEIENLDQVDFEYVSKILNGVQENREAIDTKIEEKLRKWKLNRLSNTSVSIMRIAVFEIDSMEDVPAKVAVNEALELAKLYCEDKAKDLINGVLNNFV